MKKQKENTAKLDSLKENTRSSKKEHTKDKSKDKSSTGKAKTLPIQTTQITQSVDSKGNGPKKLGVPQNFNSYRHVITNNTTGDDVQWIVHLRDVKVKPGRIA